MNIAYAKLVRFLTVIALTAMLLSQFATPAVAGSGMADLASTAGNVVSAAGHIWWNSPRVVKAAVIAGGVLLVGPALVGLGVAGEGMFLASMLLDYAAPAAFLTTLAATNGNYFAWNAPESAGAPTSPAMPGALLGVRPQ